MTRLRVHATIPASPEDVWAALSDIGSHVGWMADAEAIRFTTTQRHGVGTAFECVTRVGPIRLVDRMVCTEWIPGRVLGVRHVGLVTGDGRFTLEPAPDGSTRVTWGETLRFPLRLGGPVGAVVGGRVLARIWRGNLARLAATLAA